MGNEFLFHGSSKDFEAIKPANISVQKQGDEARVYATSNLAFASIFTMPRDYKFLQGFSGRVRLEKDGPEIIYAILPENIEPNESNIARVDAILKSELPNAKYTATDIIKILNEFYEHLQTDPVSIYAVKANQFNPAKHNSDLEFYSTEPAPTIPHLNRRYPSALTAMAETGAKIYQVNLATFLKMRVDSHDEAKQEVYRTQVFQTKPLDLDPYKEIYN
ncbi:MAG: hypothetical protein WCK98_00210 [bacterium]